MVVCESVRLRMGKTTIILYHCLSSAQGTGICAYKPGEAGSAVQKAEVFSFYDWQFETQTPSVVP